MTGQGHKVLVQRPSEVANVFSHLPSCPTGILTAQAGEEVSPGVAGWQPCSPCAGPCSQSRHLAVFPILPGASDEALVAPLAPRAFGLGECLLEGMLLGMYLIIEELSC